MISYLVYIFLTINLLNLVDKPIPFDTTKDQIYIVISNASCHECLVNSELWTSQSSIEMTAILWYSSGIIAKKEQIAFYKQYITPEYWVFSKDLEKMSNEFNLQFSPNIFVVKSGNITYFSYRDLFVNKTRV
ncbi:MAG: hypothetical protein KDC52_14935, partial [Ignavibacteriae bacterium]|nr:hypothetical protein [Ignavibacteriota bacterium]